MTDIVLPVLTFQIIEAIFLIKNIAGVIPGKEIKMAEGFKQCDWEKEKKFYEELQKDRQKWNVWPPWLIFKENYIAYYDLSNLYLVL